MTHLVVTSQIPRSRSEAIVLRTIECLHRGSSFEGKSYRMEHALMGRNERDET